MPFKFQAPKGQLRYFSLLYLLLVPLGVVAAVLTKNPGYAIAGVVFGGLTLGIWMRSKVCAYIFIFLLGGQCLAALPLLIRDGVFDWLRLARILIAGYTVFLVIQWLRRYARETPTA